VNSFVLLAKKREQRRIARHAALAVALPARRRQTPSLSLTAQRRAALSSRVRLLRLRLNLSLISCGDKHRKGASTMNNKTYNGWSNRATWLVNVWFLDCIEEPMTAEGIHSMVEEALDEALTNTGTMKGFITDMMSDERIDWEELAAHTQELEQAQ
jgi:hypothetical protein